MQPLTGVRLRFLPLVEMTVSLLSIFQGRARHWDGNAPTARLYWLDLDENAALTHPDRQGAALDEDEVRTVEQVV